MSKLSYVAGSGDKPLKYSHLPELLDIAAEQCPEKEAHVFRFLKNSGESQALTREAVTFQDLARRSLSMAAALLDLGIKPDDTIAIAGGNCPQWLYVDYACLRTKVLMIRVPANLCGAETLAGIIARFGCTALVVDEATATQLGAFIGDHVRVSSSEQISQRLNCLKQILILDKYPTDPGFPQGLTTVDNLTQNPMDMTGVMDIQHTIDPEKVAIVYPTSGSTGEPKFVAFTHFSIINGLSGDSRMRIFNDRSFTWMGGSIYTPVISQSNMVYLDNRATIGDGSFHMVHKVMAEEKITGALLMPYLIFDAMGATMDTKLDKPASLSFVCTSGERIPTSLIEFARRQFGLLIYSYGSTETLNPCYGMTSAQAANSVIKMSVTARFEVKLTGDDGRVTLRGVPGLMWTRSVFSMSHYLGDPETTSQVKTPDGWINTGDVAVMSDEGLLEIVGRTKDVISHGTTKIYPKFIEDKLMGCPGVQRVLVVGVPDPRLYQELCVCIVLEPGSSAGETEFRQHYNSHMLANTCSPRYYLTVDSLPQGTNGKFDRKLMASRAAKILGL